MLRREDGVNADAAVHRSTASPEIIEAVILIQFRVLEALSVWSMWGWNFETMMNEDRFCCR